MERGSESTYFIYENIESLQSLQSLYSFIDGYLASGRSYIHGLLLVSEKDPRELIEGWIPEGYNFNFIQRTDLSFSFKLRREIKYKGETISSSGKALLISTAQPNVYIVITHQISRFVNFALVNFFRSYRSNMTIVNFSSIDLERAIQNLQSANEDAKIMAKKVVGYTRIVDEFEFERDRLIPLEDKRIREVEVKYTHELVANSFNKAKQNDVWIDKIHFIYFVPVNEKRYCEKKFEGYLSRNGAFKCYSQFSPFFRDVISFLVDRSQELYSLYSGRGRKREERIIESKPLVIQFDYEIFSDREQFKRLITSLEDLNSASISVFHGNPFLFLSLVDYSDASTYDICVFGTNRIIITPQFNSSVASINRVVNHIFEKFNEGTILDYKELIRSANRTGA